MAASDRLFTAVSAANVIEVPPARVVVPERFFLPVWGWVTCQDTGEFELRKNPIWKQHCQPVNPPLSRP